jgi:hypothetical protein
LTGATIETPSAVNPSTSTSSLAIGFNADIAVGVFEGLPAGATVGGVASIDAIASLGVVRTSAGYKGRTPLTWALGARVGVLRESFTVPGISVTAMYRRVGEVILGSTALADAYNAVIGELSAWTVTGTIGKRVGLFGFTGGAAWSRRSGVASIQARAPGGELVGATDRSYDGTRLSGFGDITWTLTVVSLSAELGWQSAGDALTRGRTPATDAAGGGLFFGLGARLTI